MVGDTSEVRINGSGVFATTPGLFEVKSGQQKFLDGEMISPTIPLIPKLGMYNLTFEVKDKETQEALPNTEYVLINELGHTFYGITDDKGFTQAIYSNKEENYSLHVLKKQVESFLEEEEGNG